MLLLGEYRGTYFDQLQDAVIWHGRGIDKEHRIRERKPQSGAAFCVNAVLLADGASAAP